MHLFSPAMLRQAEVQGPPRWAVRTCPTDVKYRRRHGRGLAKAVCTLSCDWGRVGKKDSECCTPLCFPKLNSISHLCALLQVVLTFLSSGCWWEPMPPSSIWRTSDLLVINGMRLCDLQVKVPQLCPTLCHPMDNTVYGMLQARILEWAATPFSRGSSQPRDQTQVSCIAGKFFTS